MCADMVGYGKKIIDVGTDHAYLPIWLIMKGKIQNAVASDINLGPLQKAKDNIEKYRVKNHVKLVLSDGLQGTSPGEIDEIVIAGMGGELISNIISEAPWVKSERKNLILQPMSSEYDLRMYLYANKFNIEKETAVFSLGRVYTIIKAVYTGFDEKVPIEYPYIGKLGDNINSAVVEYMKKQLRDLENRAKGARSKGDINTYLQNVRIIDKINEFVNNFRGEMK